VNEDDVRAQAEAVCDALGAGDIDRFISHLSEQLRHNVGEVLILLPLPVSEATVESVEHGGTAYISTLELTGETDQVRVQLRWKDRDGEPTIVEVSHLSRVEQPEPAEGLEAEAGQAAATEDVTEGGAPHG
jgi:hypothetical protein